MCFYMQEHGQTLLCLKNDRLSGPLEGKRISYKGKESAIREKNQESAIREKNQL